jgi:neutral ceramidase
MSGQSTLFAAMIRFFCLLLLFASPALAEFKAGAFAQDISPTKFPAPVNGSMRANFANSIHDPMHARCLALHDGKRALVYVVVDACLLPREVSEEPRRSLPKKRASARAPSHLSHAHALCGGSDTGFTRVILTWSM